MRLAILCMLSVLTACAPKLTANLPRDEVRQIEKALENEEGARVRIDDAILVTEPELPPFICGVYSTSASRRARTGKIFMWSHGRLMSGAYHDNVYACIRTAVDRGRAVEAKPQGIG